MQGAATAAARVVHKEMSISHADFRRILAGARLAGERRDAGGAIEVVDGGRRLAITLSPERRRKLGLFDLPVTDVRLAFEGFAPADMADTLARFDRAFQRGGG